MGSVTGTVIKEDVNSHWTIKGPGDKDHCTRGESVECGQKVRLEHLTTHRNLHSHHFSSPLSSQQEISAFGEGGRGDSGDVWLVMCEGDYWTRNDNMRLKHVDTGMYLSASGHTFGRPRRECIFIKQTSILRDKLVMTSCDLIFCDIKISVYFCLGLVTSTLFVLFINK